MLRKLLQAEPVPFDRIEQRAAETKGPDKAQLGLFDRCEADEARCAIGQIARRSKPDDQSDFGVMR